MPGQDVVQGRLVLPLGQIDEDIKCIVARIDSIGVIESNRARVSPCCSYSFSVTLKILVLGYDCKTLNKIKDFTSFLKKIHPFFRLLSI
jgi:hypothetical protein